MNLVDTEWLDVLADIQKQSETSLLKQQLLQANYLWSPLTVQQHDAKMSKLNNKGQKR